MLPSSFPGSLVERLTPSLDRLLADGTAADPLVRNRRLELCARLALLLLLLGLFGSTWAHWGSVTVDCGREMYVPEQLTRGKVLYRDLWYPYGPLAPYLNSLLFRAFGVHLNVLYLAGLLTTAAIAQLLYAVSRRLLPAVPAFTVAAGVVLQAMLPSIFNYILPYSYAALYAGLFSLLLVYFLLKEASGAPGRNLVLAGGAAGLAMLTKHEFGAACYATLLLFVVLRAVSARSLSRLCQDLLKVSPGALVNLLVYGWFAASQGWGFLVQANWIGAPGSYFMKVYGRHWVERFGLRLRPGELIECVGGALGSLAGWILIASATSFLLKSRRRWLGVAAGITVLACVAVWKLHLYWPLREDVLSGLAFPRAMFFVALGVFAFLMVGVRRDSAQRLGSQKLAALLVAFQAMAIGFRVLVRVLPSGYAIFYNSLLLLVFVGAVFHCCRRAALRLDAGSAPRVLALVCVFQLFGLVLILEPEYRNQPGERLSTARGTIYVRGGRASAYPSAISLMRQEAAKGNAVLSLPEDVSLYFFAGVEAPTRWYVLVPGVLPPGEYTRSYLRELERSRPSLILLSNRSTWDYGVPWFGEDYNQEVLDWIRRHYQAAGQVGRYVRNTDPRPWGALVYRRVADSPVRAAP